MIPLGKLMLRACMEVGRHFPFKFAWGLYIKGCTQGAATGKVRDVHYLAAAPLVVLVLGQKLS